MRSTDVSNSIKQTVRRPITYVQLLNDINRAFQVYSSHLVWMKYTMQKHRFCGLWCDMLNLGFADRGFYRYWCDLIGNSKIKENQTALVHQLCPCQRSLVFFGCTSFSVLRVRYLGRKPQPNRLCHGKSFIYTTKSQTAKIGALSPTRRP